MTERERVVVTGAAGFIGHHLLSALVKEGYEVIALDNKYSLVKLPAEEEGVTKIQADICDHIQMNDFGRTLNFDSVIHLAAMAAPRIAELYPKETFRVNVQGTFNVLQMARIAGVKRFLFASTAHVYGISPKYMPTNEVHPLALQDTYTSSKIIGEKLCQLFYDYHNIPYIILRMFNAYGPGQSTDYFIPAKIKEALQGSICLRGRSVTKDFLYVGDAIDAMVKALRSQYVGWLNVGSGEQVALERVAQIIAEKLNVPLSFDETEDKGPTAMQCDLTRIKMSLGWQPTTSIEEGLTKTIESFKKE